jgi:hypothetical protein
VVRRDGDPEPVGFITTHTVFDILDNAVAHRNDKTSLFPVENQGEIRGGKPKNAT